MLNFACHGRRNGAIKRKSSVQINFSDFKEKTYLMLNLVTVSNIRECNKCELKLNSIATLFFRAISRL